MSVVAHYDSPLPSRAALDGNVSVFFFIIYYRIIEIAAVIFSQTLSFSFSDFLFIATANKNSGTPFPLSPSLQLFVLVKMKHLLTKLGELDLTRECLLNFYSSYTVINPFLTGVRSNSSRQSLLLLLAEQRPLAIVSLASCIKAW